jgi:hypothetical protein
LVALEEEIDAVGCSVVASVIEAGVAEPRSHAVAVEGAVLAGRAVALRLCSRLGFSPVRATVGKDRDWVRRQLR